jgi:uncharacterized membrane protein YsdA (DUF1294 family)
MIPAGQSGPILGAVFVTNLAVFLLYGWDKAKARSNGWRIPERTLLLSSFAGPFGALAGMRLFRHKTRHLSFVLVVTAAVILQAAIFILLLNVMI